MTGDGDVEPANDRTQPTVLVTPECSARSFGFKDGWPGLQIGYGEHRLTFEADDDLEVAERFAKHLALAALTFGSRCQAILDGRRG